MYYDEEKIEFANLISKLNDSPLTAPMTPSLAEAQIIDCLFNIANELHELNKCSKQEYDDGR